MEESKTLCLIDTFNCDISECITWLEIFWEENKNTTLTVLSGGEISKRNISIVYVVGDVGIQHSCFGPLLAEEERRVSGREMKQHGINMYVALKIMGFYSVTHGSCVESR